MKSHVDQGYRAVTMTLTDGVSEANRAGSTSIKIQNFPDPRSDQLTRSAREGMSTAEVMSFRPFRTTLFRETLLSGSNSK